MDDLCYCCALAPLLAVQIDSNQILNRYLYQNNLEDRFGWKRGDDLADVYASGLFKSF